MSLLNSVLLSFLDTGLPPVLEDPDDTVKSIFSNIDDLPIHKLPVNKCIIPRVPDPGNCFIIAPAPPHTTLRVDHDPVSGELLGFGEVFVGEDSGKSARNSTSLRRQPCPLSDGIRGNSANFPFLPGGFQDVDLSKIKVDLPTNVTENINFKELLNIPPGLPSGMKFENTAIDWFVTDQSETTGGLSAADLLGVNLNLIEGKRARPKENGVDSSQPSVLDAVTKLADVIKLEHRLERARDDFIYNASNIVGSGDDDDGNQFACVIDIQQPIGNFKKLLPNPAIKYDFELDPFQKQAILQMEKKNNVFVAAHTSAGKTVVAEYAISLALNSMTKAIYTSPIKALSNQKFREFRQKFGDVGLVTGDVQIKPESNVLVMTTEILRSMLYNGSGIIRDLEWVIFDEVHYINDAERGVVWEEVLILLPAHVKIVMLSATVPNTREFAEWVGRIKRKKVYVISTPKRPVPLEHYLYTGNSNKTSKELFLILDENKNFINEGHKKAVEAKKKRASKVEQSYGAKKEKSTDCDSG